VTEVYLKNNYLKSYGYKKLTTSDSQLALPEGKEALMNTMSGGRKYQMNAAAAPPGGKKQGI
jgi:hypothetical protein